MQPADIEGSRGVLIKVFNNQKTALKPGMTILLFCIIAIMASSFLSDPIFALMLNVISLPAVIGAEMIWIHFKYGRKELEKFRKAEIIYGTAKDISIAEVIRVWGDDVDTDATDLDYWSLSDFRHFRKNATSWISIVIISFLLSLLSWAEFGAIGAIGFIVTALYTIIPVYSIYNSKRLQKTEFQGERAFVLIRPVKGGYLIASPVGSGQMAAFQIQRGELYTNSSKTLALLGAIVLAVGAVLYLLDFGFAFYIMLMGAFFLVFSIIYGFVGISKKRKSGGSS